MTKTCAWMSYLIRRPSSAAMSSCGPRCFPLTYLPSAGGETFTLEDRSPVSSVVLEFRSDVQSPPLTGTGQHVATTGFDVALVTAVEDRSA